MTPMEAATAEWLTRLGVRNYAKSSVRTYAHCLALCRLVRRAQN